MRSVFSIFACIVAFAAIGLFYISRQPELTVANSHPDQLGAYRSHIIQRYNSLRAFTRKIVTQQPAILGSYVPFLKRSTSTSTTISSAVEKVGKMTATETARAQAFPGLPAVPPQDPSLNKPLNQSVPRKIKTNFLAIEQAEGAGARVRRSIGTPKLRRFSPFLMLDHFTIGEGAGFPDHPHRGQETITYLLQGGVDHEDFAGNKGTLDAGDLQFMTAGRGIVHAEMPRVNPDGSPNVGLQLWVDLPKHLKACEPRYRDLRAKEIPSVEVDDGKVTVKVISGQSHGVDSVQELAYTPVWLLDITIRPGGKIAQNLPVGWNAFAYILNGTVTFGTTPNQQVIEKFNNVVFEQTGDTVFVSVDEGADEEARFVIIAGTPLDQEVVQYGPFVLSSQQEVYQAMMDYSTFTNGFERAENWESEIGKRMGH